MEHAILFLALDSTAKFRNNKKIKTIKPKNPIEVKLKI